MHRRVLIKRQINLNNIIQFLFCVSLILTTGTMYGVMDSFYNDNKGPFFFRILCLLISTILIIVCILNHKFYFTKYQVFVFLLMILFFFIYLLVTNFNTNSCIEGLILPFVLFFIMFCLIEIERFVPSFIKCYSKIIVIISAISLIVYFCGPVLHIIDGKSFKFFNNGYFNTGVNYFYLSFINNWQIENIFGRAFVRNIGIFMEAPGFASHLVLSLFIELFCKEFISKKNIIILLITVLTTFSSKGLILSALLIFLYMYSDASYKYPSWKKIKFIVFPFISCFVLWFSIYVFSNKILKTGNSGSYFVRISDMEAAFKTWLERPFFGVGFYNLTKIYSMYSYERNTGDPTMGIFNILAFGGIYMLSLYFIGLYRIFSKIKPKRNARVFIFLIIALMCISASQYNYMMILIIALGWALPLRRTCFIKIG